MLSISSFMWTVIGAGPAGIAAVGQLLDKNIPPNEILWIDPDFSVGDFGSKWCKVSSNTSVKLFKRFYNHCNSFDYPSVAHHFKITQLDDSETCLLEYAAEPLRWITDSFRQKIHTICNIVDNIELKHHYWHITFKNFSDSIPTESIRSKNIILAIGSEQKHLDYDNLSHIPLTTALDPDQLRLNCHPNDTIAVFGSSHSAIIILQSLIEQTNVQRIINFYQNPLRYAIYFDDWILFDDSGLKGATANWARKYLHGEIPHQLIRLISTPELIKEFLPQCTKAIYSIGFNRRNIKVNGITSFNYNAHNGIIAPGLFGIGIAFPEVAVDRYGTLEYRVGMWKFMDYLNRVLPLWLRYQV